MIILSKKFPHDGQDFEIFVKYDEVEKQPIEVKSIQLHTHGNWYPIGTLMTRFFKDAVWQLVTETNWEKVREEFEGNHSKLNNIHPVMQEMLRPHLLPGGLVLNN
jgi:hypothetical protein